MVGVQIKRVRGVLWVTVTCPPSKGKRASAEADKAARKWVKAHGDYQRAFRRSSSQTFSAEGVHYRAAFALH